MSAVAWVRRLRDRPIAEHERRAAMATVAVLLTASAILLAITRPAGQARHPAPRIAAAPLARASRPPTPTGGAKPAATVAPMVARAARKFLVGYLAYLYGHGLASAVRGATRALSRSLRAHAPRVSPGMRARSPRVVSLHAVSAPVGLVGVSVLVNDGELVSYPVGLLIASEDGRLLVSGVEGT